ncbi:hypothetical protein KIV56_03280 [Cryobacterium breve]|uniref:Uncharacterized protein n=1 Tax=Cryobacterium breve TaxID=1259258 RepID=A0ABY7NIZ9_9MICO|nr:hypothetical protein KIV56_03280 [Cryobacterium breve]
MVRYCTSRVPSRRNGVYMPTFVYGLIALATFGALGGVVWSYRDVANRHAEKARAYAAAHGRVDQH